MQTWHPTWPGPWLGRCALLGVLVGFGGLPVSAAGQAASLSREDRPPSVLFVDDYDLNRPVWQLSFGAIQDRVREDIADVVFFTETLDVQQISDPEILAEGRRWLVQKYVDRRLDLLMAHGEGSLEAVLELRGVSGRNTPILYMRADGTRPIDPAELPAIPYGRSLLLGSVEAEVVRVVKRLLPETRRLVLVVDSDSEAEALLSRFRGEALGSMVLVPLIRPSHARVDAAVREAGPDVVVYYTLVREDEEGRPWGQQDYLQALAARIAAPVLTPFTTQLGTGTLGGSQVDPIAMGHFVGGTVVDILSETAAEYLPAATFESWSLTLDWGVARRYGIRPNRVPADVTWVGKPERFWEAFPRTTGALAGLFLLLLGTGLNLAAGRRSLERARNARSRLSQRLMAVVDGDRSRVARDLHDDLCQEMTVVALELDRTQPKAGDRIRDLIDRTRAIARDLHAAPLDRIPFQDAVVALARNVETAASLFRETDGRLDPLTIRVELTDWPLEMPRDIALNLYRVIQEALQNVVRHSEARTCKVHLQALPGLFQVVVADDGVGFQEKTSEDLGLGMVGMRERMLSLGGKFRIDSGIGKGTRIEAVVPFIQPAQEPLPATMELP